MTAEGGMVDLRFSVVNTEKAHDLEEILEDFFLMDEKSGITGGVAHSSKVGSLKDVNLDIEGRINYIIFGNPGGLIQTGSP